MARAPFSCHDEGWPHCRGFGAERDRGARPWQRRRRRNPRTPFTVNLESTYDWRAGPWTVPINFMVSQLVRVGKLPVSLQVGARYYPEGPRSAPDWGLRFTVTPLFPLSRPAASGPSLDGKSD